MYLFQGTEISHFTIGQKIVSSAWVYIIISMNKANKTTRIRNIFSDREEDIPWSRASFALFDSIPKEHQDKFREEYSQYQQKWKKKNVKI